MSEFTDKMNRSAHHLIRSGKGMVGRTLTYHLEPMIDNTRDCLSSLHQTGEATARTVDALERQVADLQQRLQRAEDQVAEYGTQLSGLTGKVDMCLRQLAVVEREQANLQMAKPTATSAAPSDPHGQFITQLLSVTDLAANLKSQLASLESNSLVK